MSKSVENTTKTETVTQEFYREVFGLNDKPIPSDLAEAVAGWCVFVGDQLGGSDWLVIAAKVIREQARELKETARTPPPIVESTT